MRERPTVLIAVVLAIICIGSLPICSDTSAGARTIAVTGLICEVGDSDPVPAENVKVTIISTAGEYTAATDETGYFTIEGISIENITERLQFSCSLPGYSIFQLPYCMVSENGTTYIDLTRLAAVSGTYTITGDLQHSILLADTTVSLSFTVTDSKDNKSLRNAEITLLNGSVKFSGKTNDDGVCIMSSKIPIGAYSISVHCDGYESYSNTEFNVTKTATAATIPLDEKEMSTYLGLTLYHLMMVIGVSVGLLLVVIAYALCTRSWKRVDTNEKS